MNKDTEQILEMIDLLYALKRMYQRLKKQDGNEYLIQRNSNAQKSALDVR